MFLFLTFKHLLIWIKTQICDKIVEILYSNRSTLQTKQSTPLLLPSIQSWGVYCFLKVTQTAAQHCMEGRGKKEFYFPLLKSVKCQKVPLRQSISTNFVADCCLVHFWSQFQCLPSQFHQIWNYIKNYHWLPCAQVNALTASRLK